MDVLITDSDSGALPDAEEHRKGRIEKLAEQLVDAASFHYIDPGTNERFVHCLICHVVDGHQTNCPIESLEEWINGK